MHAIGFANPQAQGMLERKQEKLLKEQAHSHKHFEKPKNEQKKDELTDRKTTTELASLESDADVAVVEDEALKPTVKFVGSVSVLIAALLLVFLISSGLLFV